MLSCDGEEEYSDSTGVRVIRWKIICFCQFENGGLGADLLSVWEHMILFGLIAIFASENAYIFFQTLMHVPAEQKLTRTLFWTCNVAPLISKSRALISSITIASSGMSDLSDAFTVSRFREQINFDPSEK